MQAVCVILDVKPAKAKDEAGKQINDYWKPSVALLNEKDFLNKLKSYDKDNINSKLIERIRTTYLTNEGFTPENAKKASPAAEGMCKWVHAMSSYEKVCPPSWLRLHHKGGLCHTCCCVCYILCLARLDVYFVHADWDTKKQATALAEQSPLTSVTDFQ